MGCKTRAIEFNSLQRCASHIVSRVDITEAFQVGGAAVKAAFEGETGDYVTEEFINYVKPLIQAELTSIMVDGLPRHLYYKEKI